MGNNLQQSFRRTYAICELANTLKYGFTDEKRAGVTFDLYREAETL